MIIFENQLDFFENHSYMSELVLHIFENQDDMPFLITTQHEFQLSTLHPNNTLFTELIWMHWELQFPPPPTQQQLFVKELARKLIHEVGQEFDPNN